MRGAGDGAVAELLAQVVPGLQLRDGLERVLRAHMGALIVLGDGPDVLAICSGGFHIDAEMTPQRLSELAKMDGAIVCNRDASRIAWANVHLVPDPSATTTETGTRHRTAERVARGVDVPVIAVSEEMGTITLYRRTERRLLRSAEYLVSRANHLLGTLERFRQRLDEVDASLTASEIGDVVTVRDVAAVLQRSEMVTRVSSEISDLLDELGEHGRLLRLQLDELIVGVTDELRLVLEDYLAEAGVQAVDLALAQLAKISTDDLLGLERIVEALEGQIGDAAALDEPLSPRGLRLLKRLPQLSADIVVRLADHFGGLHRIVRASTAELARAIDLSEDQARLVKDGLSRLAETSILDRYS